MTLRHKEYFEVSCDVRAAALCNLLFAAEGEASVLKEARQAGWYVGPAGTFAICPRCLRTKKGKEQLP